MSVSRRTLYPEIDAYDEGMLTVDEEVPHRLWYGLYGKSESEKTALFLHGGPGGGCSPGNARLFDPNEYRVVLFDQRGAGKSTPNGSLERNTTWHLVEDIEKCVESTLCYVSERIRHTFSHTMTCSTQEGFSSRLRLHLGVDKWHVVLGGSWGSTLAMTYAIKHPAHVRSLVLRGVFLFDVPSATFVFEQDGASETYPDLWERFAGHIPSGERMSLLHAYYRRVSSEDRSVCVPAARELVRWELSISLLQHSPELIEDLVAKEDFIVPFARSLTHYAVRSAFFPGEEEESAGEDHSTRRLGAVGPGSKSTGFPWIVRHLHQIAHIPTAIVHGRQDIVCRPRAAWEVYRRMENCTLEFVHDAGHAGSEPGTVDGLVRATDRFAVEV